MGDARSGKTRRRAGRSEKDAEVQARRRRLLEDFLLSSTTERDVLDALEASAIRAVRALGAELNRRSAEEDSAGLVYGRQSGVLAERSFQKLFSALTGVPVDSGVLGLVGAVELAAEAERRVGQFWEKHNVPKAERDVLDLDRLADVLREVPGALRAPSVLNTLDMLQAPGSDAPEIAVLPREGGGCVALNIGTKQTTYGEWLGFSNKGTVLEPWADGSRERKRRALADALRDLVAKRPVRKYPREWRPGCARAVFLESFRDGAQRGTNLWRFTKETGLRVTSGAFRLALHRAKPEAAGATASVSDLASGSVTDRGGESPSGMPRVAPGAKTVPNRRSNSDGTKANEKRTRHYRPSITRQPSPDPHAANGEQARVWGRDHREDALEATPRRGRPGLPASRAPDPRSGLVPEGRRDHVDEKPTRGNHDHRRADPRGVVRGRRLKEPP